MRAGTVCGAHQQDPQRRRACQSISSYSVLLVETRASWNAVAKRFKAYIGVSKAIRVEVSDREAWRWLVKNKEDSGEVIESICNDFCLLVLLSSEAKGLRGNKRTVPIRGEEYVREGIFSIP